MTAPTMPPEARAQIDQYLDAVERALAGHTREQRRAITDDLEAQIRDMLAARTATPTAADVVAVLQQLDPPAAYAQQAAGTPAPPPPPPAAPVPPASPAAAPVAPRLSRTAVWGAILVTLGLAAVLVFAVGMFFVSFNVSSHASSASMGPPPMDVVSRSPATPANVYAELHDRRTPSSPALTAEAGPTGATVHLHDASGAMEIPTSTPTPISSLQKDNIWARFAPCIVMLPLALLLLAFPLLGTLLGWIAVLQIRESAGKLYGLGLALFDGLCYPLLLLDALLVVLLTRLGSVVVAEKLALLAAVGAILALDILISWALWRFFRKPERTIKIQADVELHV